MQSLMFIILAFIGGNTTGGILMWIYKNQISATIQADIALLKNDVALLKPTVAAIATKVTTPAAPTVTTASS